MKCDLKYFFLILLISSSIVSVAQVAIPYDAAEDPTAELAIESTDKGVLVPVLSINEVNSINAPANGLFVFDKENNQIRYFNGSEWVYVGVMQQYTTAARPASSAIEGTLIYDTDLNQLLFYDGTGWKTLDKAP